MANYIHVTLEFLVSLRERREKGARKVGGFSLHSTDSQDTINYILYYYYFTLYFLAYYVHSQTTISSASGDVTVADTNWQYKEKKTLVFVHNCILTAEGESTCGLRTTTTAGKAFWVFGLMVLLWSNIRYIQFPVTRPVFLHSLGKFPLTHWEHSKTLPENGSYTGF